MTDLAKVLQNLSPEQRELFLLRLNKMNKAQGGRAQAQIPHRSRADGAVFPLSFAQQSLWFLDQLQPGAAAYNIPQAVRLDGPLDTAALERAVNTILHRHESLRTVFRLVDGQPAQIVLPAEDRPLPLADLRHLPPEAREAEAHRLATEESLRSFDLGQGPLLRAELVRTADDQHFLLLNTHHIASDGWSMSVLVREIAQLYTAFVQGQPAPLAALPVQYPDFAAWQQEHLQGEALQRQIDYWKQQLGGALPVLQLPLDRPRPPVQTFRGAHHFFSIPPQLVEALRALSQQEGATLFMTVLAAFKTLLYRYAGQDDVIVGSPNANRNHPQLEGLIGCFSDILVLRSSLSGDPTFREVLRRVRETTMKAYANQDVPFTKVVEVVQPERNLSYNPLFQVMFSFLDAPESMLELPDVRLHMIEMESGAIDFDLFLTLFWRGSELTGSLGYNIDLFESETARRMLDDLLALLEAVAAQPDRRFSELPLLRRSTIAVAASFTAEPVAEALGFWMKQLDLPARVVFAPYNQVFQQLLDPAGLLGSNRDGVNVLLVRFEDWLRFGGDADPEALVERNLADLIELVGAAAARGSTPYLLCVCPAAPDLPPARAALFAALETRLVTELGRVPGVYVVTTGELAAAYPVADSYDAATDAAGHIPFTPAGFSALGTLLARRIYALRSAPYKVIVLDADQTLWRGIAGEDGPHSVAVDGPWRALQQWMRAQHDAGMLLCLASKNEEADVAAVFEQRADMPLQRSHFVSWAVNWRPKSENIRRLASELGLGLDSFIFVDDNPVECAEVSAACPEVLVLQLPQQPEQIPDFLAHVWAFDHLKLTGEDRRRTAMYQQNLERERVRREAPTLAEFLGGLGLRVRIAPPSAEQIARVAQLTQRTNQFNTTALRRSEREIDVVAEGGCLAVEVADRFGDYGLVGAMTFAAGAEALEVDSFMLSCRVLGRGVEQRMLARLADEAASRGLAQVDLAFVPSARNQPAADFLRWIGEQYARPQGEGLRYRVPLDVALAAPERLLTEPAPGADTSETPAPAAAVAAAWRASRQVRFAAELRTPAQILAAVAGPQRARAAGQTMFVEARSEDEATLAAIWARALRLDRVGAFDNFFDLGGHSLLATQIGSEVQQTFGVTLSLQIFFEAPTVARMAERIADARRQSALRQVPPIRPAARDGALPLSFAQQRLWFISQIDPNSPAYNIPQAVRLHGRLDAAALERALNEIVRRHEVLRSTFAMQDSRPVQLIAPALTLPVTLVELPETPDREAEIQRLLTAETLRPFSLTRGPLLRVLLLRLGEQEHILLITMHHIITDAWSLGIFVQELATLYETFVRGDLSPLPELPIQYADFAVWQQDWLQGAQLERQLSYWREKLAGAPPVLDLPADRPRPANPSMQGAHRAFTLPRALSDKLTALSQRERVTLFMTMLAAFDTLIHRYTGRTDVVVGSPIANRNHPDIAGLIGFFVNTLVLRTDLADDPSFRELLGRVRETTLGAYDHQDLPFDRLVGELQPERNLNYNPLVQVLFVFQNVPMPELELPGLTLGLLESAEDVTPFDLMLNLWESPEGIGGALVYSTDLFEPATIDRLLRHFETLLAGIVERPDLPISQLPLMSAEERQHMVSAAQATKKPLLSSQLKSRLAQALRSKDES